MYALNEIVTVDSYYFSNGSSLKAFPRSVTFGTTHHTFVDGLQYLIKKGQDMVKLFDMSDGNLTYRLKLEDGQWTLLSTK